MKKVEGFSEEKEKAFNDFVSKIVVLLWKFKNE